MASQCTATSKQTGERCRQRPIPGGTVCRFHGGKAPAVAAKAAERQAEEAAAKTLRKVWDPNAAPVTDAVAAMQRLAGQLHHSTGVLGARLGGEEPCEECGRSDLDMSSPEALAWLRVVREQRQLLEAMERLGIAQRYVQVESARVELMAVALERVFEVLGLDEEQRAVGGRVLLAELRSSSASGVPA